MNIPQRHAPIKMRMAGSSLAQVFLVSVKIRYGHVSSCQLRQRTFMKIDISVTARGVNIHVM